MRHLAGIKSVPHSEVNDLFLSAEVQEHLRRYARKVQGPEPFLYLYVSNDDPAENLAVVWEFSGPHDAIVESLIFNDVQYIPEI